MDDMNVPGEQDQRRGAGVKRETPSARVTLRMDLELREYLEHLGGQGGVSKAIRMAVRFYRKHHPEAEQTKRDAA